jgi:hypothetical protein
METRGRRTAALPQVERSGAVPRHAATPVRPTGPDAHASETGRLLALQRLAGNEAVTELIGRSTPVLRLQRYESGEHAQMGARPHEKEKVFDINGVAVTYGEMIALGDFYPDINDVYKAPKEELEGLVKLIQQDKAAATGESDAAGKPTEWVSNEQWEAATKGRKHKFWRPPDYVDLASKNDTHFAVENKKQWVHYHVKALGLSQNGDLEKALATNAFGDHYLTDAFSAGHLIEKAKVRGEAEDNMKHVDIGMFAHRIAECILEDGKAQVALDGYEVSGSPAPSFISPWRPITVDSMASIVVFMSKHKKDEFYSMFAKSIHDKLNKDIKEGSGGVWVTNLAGFAAWQLSGDQTLNMSPTTLAVIRTAVAESRGNITDAYNKKDVDYRAMLENVWRYTPYPVDQGATLVSESEATLTNPANWETAEWWARIAVENLDELIDQLTSAHMMRRKTGAHVESPLKPGDYPAPAPGMAPA